MAPPFYSKNGCGNRFSRMGAVLLRAHFAAVFPGAGDERFAAWWSHAEEHGLCYSFECVVPRILGDHGATPSAAYMVLTCISHTGGGGSFLSPAQLLRLATAWRLPVNEVTFVPWEKAALIEDSLHTSRWTMLDGDAATLLDGAGVQQRFLTHGQTQGSVLEGFVLMALDASVEDLAPLVAAYDAATAFARDAALASALELGGVCSRREESLVAQLDEPMVGREPQPIEGMRRGDGQEAAWEAACNGDEREPVCALFRRLRALYSHRVTLKAYEYQGALQMQVDVGDDQIFFGWKVHLALGDVAPLYRGMVLQFDGFTPPPIETAMLTADESAGGAAAAPSAAVPGARVLGISKLKCLNYLMRTFGVRNQLPTLVDRGAAAYIAATERFLKLWGVPTEHHERLRAMFTSWSREVAMLGDSERRTLRGGEYLAVLEPFLAGERRCALASSFGLDQFFLLIINLSGTPLPAERVREYAPGMQPCTMHDSAQLARAGSVIIAEQPPSGRLFIHTAGIPSLVLFFPPAVEAETKWHKMWAASMHIEQRYPQLANRVFVAPSVGAVVVSSDDERKRGGKFDAVLASSVRDHELVCYDKNVPNAEGLAKLIRVLGAVEQEHHVAVRVLPVVPSYLDHDQAWGRVEARPATHAALTVHVNGGAPEAYSIFKNVFFDACLAFQPQAAQLPGAVTSDAFWRDVDATHQLAARVLEQVPLAAPLATLRTATETPPEISSGGHGAWACAEIPATKLHVTLVPPASALALGGNPAKGVERERSAALRRLRPLANQGLRVHVLRYILATSQRFGGDDRPSGRSGRSGRNGRESDTARRVGFWEVGGLEGLPDAVQYAEQRDIYHITDTASLVGCAPKDAADVLRAMRHGDLGAEWDVTGVGMAMPADVFAQIRIVS